MLNSASVKTNEKKRGHSAKTLIYLKEMWKAMVDYRSLSELLARKEDENGQNK